MTGWSQQTIVFPAVSDEVEGRNGSLWVTVVRVIKVNPLDTVTLRRKWVCLPEGGFADDPMPEWVELGLGRAGRAGLDWGYTFLPPGSSRLGAFALEVEGGEVIAHSYVVDVSRGYHATGSYSAGQGQFVEAMTEPLRGTSHIPWLGGCRNSPCSADNPSKWDYHRNNIGLINPNPEPLSITGIVVPFSNQLGQAMEIEEEEPESFSKEVPPYGWLQFNWVSEVRHDVDPFGYPWIPDAGFVINLRPSTDRPYYAYASVVFSPDPDSDNQMFSDPMFVPARPGYLPPISESEPQPK